MRIEHSIATDSQGPSPMRILVADDNNSDRLLISAILKKQGHEVIAASDGLEAVELFKQERPEMVLLDALMPRMDGFEAAEIIKSIAGEEFVPVIFLTSLKEADSLALCLEAGGDDFIAKPYNSIILKAKLNAFQRMRGMHRTVQLQRDQIANHNEHLIREQEVAKRVFDKVAHGGCLNAPNIQHLLSPLAVFNGDVLLAAFSPSGGMYVLLGDFTGHGLSAAIGAMPLAQTFYSMTEKGFSVTDLLRELNSKLKSILPVGLFCCSCIVHLDFVERSIEVWNGGLPDCFLYRAVNGEIVSLPSSHLPLGVLSERDFKADTQIYEMDTGDRVYLWSDGIHEAVNPEGDMFGEGRLRAVFNDVDDPAKLFDTIVHRVNNFVGPHEHTDDVSLVEVEMVEPEVLSHQLHGMRRGAVFVGPRDWSLSYEARPDTLRDFNPLPFLLHMLMEVPGLRSQSGQLYTILAELYSNALEHGVIGLDSKLKASPEGFADYYRMRSERLACLVDGYVRFGLTYKGGDLGGVLTVSVNDSGPGFDYQSRSSDLTDANRYSGRGLSLLRSMCQRLEFFGRGNEVEVEFRWGDQQVS